MKTIKNLALGVLAALALAPMLRTQITQAAPFGSAFTYQGRLNFSGSPASNGLYDFRFELHSDATTLSLIGTPTTVALSAVPVTNGLFTVPLDFGAPAFTSGEARWLQLQVATNGFTPLTALNPRQRLTPTPQAIYAGSAGTAATASSVAAGAVTSAGLASGAVNGTAIADGSITAADVNAPSFNTTFWRSGGNAVGATPGANVIGTTDNQPLNMKVNDTLALQIRPGVTVPNIVGGLAAQRPSVIASGVSGAVIAGGNAPSGGVNGFGAGDFQAVFDDDGTVGGGFGNKAGSNNGNVTDAAFATVAGGVFNGAANYAATVAGGDSNLADGQRAAVLGGYANRAGGETSTVGGGRNNQATGTRSTIGGGELNTNSGFLATVGGGLQNTSSGFGATVGGGGNNTSSSEFATVPGGEFNVAGGAFSFAAGYRAKAAHDGSFVWADFQGADFASTGNDQFLIRASGGVGIGTTGPSGKLTVATADDTTPSFVTSFDSRHSIFGTAAEGVGLSYSASTGAGYITALAPGVAWKDLVLQASTLSFNPSGGATAFSVLNNGNVGIGTETPSEKLHVNGNILASGNASVCALTIRGGCDLAEPFQMSGKDLPKGAVVVIDEANPGHLRLSESAYDTRVAGIISGANGVNPGISLHQEGVMEGGQNVALSGRVYVQADASNGPIKPGDLLTTSATPGHAMKVSEPTRAQGAIIGKAMSSLKEGTGMVLVLVSLQ